VITDEKRGKEVPSSIFSISPSVKGKAVWTNYNTLTFTPDAPLDWGANYTATLRLGKILDVPRELSLLTFNIQTTEKQFVVNHSGLSFASDNYEMYELKGLVETADEIENQDIEKILSAKQNGKSLKINWEHQPKLSKHQFTISGIIRTEEGSDLKLEWNGDKIKAKKSKGSDIVNIPKKSDFVVSSVNVINIPDQYVEVVFSDPLNSTADFRGLIMIDNQSVSKVQVQNNLLKIYPAKRLAGKKKLNLGQSIACHNGKTLTGVLEWELKFGNLKPQVRLLGNGIIVPQSEGLYFPFEAVSLNAIDVRITKIFTNNIVQFFQDNNLNSKWDIQKVGRVIKRLKVDLTSKGPRDLSDWNAFNLDLSKLIDVEPGAIYNVEIGFRKKYSLYECSSEMEETDEYPAIEEEEEYVYSEIYYNNYYNWEHYDNPCSQSYFSHNRFVNRNIFGSNYGIIAKTDNAGKTYVYLTNLITAKPESGVEIQFYDYQNQLLTKANTDAQGMISVKTERMPFLIVAKKDKEVGYLKTDNSMALSTSNFDVSGRIVEKGIKGFVYGERDVWRPGDSVFVSFILEDKLKTLPIGHPLTMEIYNPRGQFVNKFVKTRTSAFIYPFAFTTKPDDPTGNWQIKIKAGTVVFTKSIQIETVKPNRLKVELDFNDGLLSSRSQNKGLLASKWLHGTPARNLKARVDVSFSPYAPSFDKFKNYDFSTPYDNFYGNQITLFDGMLDENGKANVKLDFKPNNEVGGFLKATFITKVFENGGDFSINRFSKPFSPYPSYVGLDINWSYKSWNKLNSDEDHVIGVATVDEKGNPVSQQKIEVKLYELDYRWWYDSNEENLASYAGKTYHKPVFSTTISTSGSGKGEFSLKANEDRWGRHLLLITSPNGHTCGQVIYFGWSWGRGNQRGDAQVLALVTEKEKYKAGEEVTISFPANKEARALITFENGSSIIGQEWITNLESFTKYTFKATPEMSPNVFVHVTLIQPHGQTANDLPIRLYGITPVMVEDPGTHLYPEIKMPDEVRPLKEFTVKISEKNRKPMDYTLAIVDEGLLDLTNFKTPEPWSNFYAREALGVKTYDMYSFVMGSFGSRLESMFAVGGSDEINNNSKKKAERFKPVVKVLGPFRLAAGKEGVHKITLPQYIGSVRTMVIAADEAKYGNSEKTVPVKEPLMVLATMPRVLSPNETVDLPVTVFALDKSVKKVQVKITLNEYLSFSGKSDTTLFFDDIGEKDVIFSVRSANKIGIAKLKTEVSSGNEKSFHEIELDIRLPNLPTVQSEFKALEPGQTWSTLVETLGISGTNRAKIEITALPPLNLGRRLGYLISFPHGCVEQTTSAVFPQLFLPRLIDLPADEQTRISKNVEAGIDKLHRFQTSDGGFAYWPGNTHSESWASCYVGHFMIEAEKAGYIVPTNIKRNWMAYTSKRAMQHTAETYSYQLYTQAYRLYLLALAGDPQIPAMNRLRNSTKMDNQTRWMLAGAYALAGLREAAYQLIDFRNMKPDPTGSETYGSPLRDEGVILQTLLALNEMEHAVKLATEISKKLSSNEWHSTQTIAYSLVALANFAQKSGAASELNYSLSVNEETMNDKQKGKIRNIDLRFDKQGKSALKIQNNGKGIIYLNLVNEGVLASLDTSQAERSLQLTVQYLDNSGNTINPTTLTQGTDFMTWVTIKNKTGIRVDNIALTQMFPAGWEIINTRLFETDERKKNSIFDYRDYRDDRVHTYFRLEPYQTKSFLVNLNASYSGNYLLAPVTCEAMYDNSYYAKTKGQWVTVKK
jgi:alpha-2-macroglobulin